VGVVARETLGEEHWGSGRADVEEIEEGRVDKGQQAPWPSFPKLFPLLPRGHLAPILTAGLIDLHGCSSLAIASRSL
jgi:hypothetical protein